MRKRKQRRRLRPRPIDTAGLKLVEVVADGAVAATNQALGKLVPVLILDTRNRSDIIELARVQRFLPPGDVKTIWGLTFDNRHVPEVLIRFNFERPVETTLSVRLEVEKYGMLIDQIITDELVYLQPGQPGDRLKFTMDAPRLLVEARASGEIRLAWPEYLISGTAPYFLDRGHDRRTARRLAVEAIELMRTSITFRMPH